MAHPIKNQDQVPSKIKASPKLNKDPKASKSL
jgi:hypothetical protein